MGSGGSHLLLIDVIYPKWQKSREIIYGGFGGFGFRFHSVGGYKMTTQEPELRACPSCGVKVISWNTRPILDAMLWEDTRDVKFDGTVVMGKGWDYFGWESLREEAQGNDGRYAVWPEGKKWSAYGGSLGLMSYCLFDSEEEAKKEVESWNKHPTPTPDPMLVEALEKAYSEGYDEGYFDATMSDYNLKGGLEDYLKQALSAIKQDKTNG